MDAGTIEGAIVMRDLASAVVARVDQALAKLEGRAGQTATAVEKAGSRFDKMQEALGKAERTLKSAGTSLSLGLTLPLASAAAAAFKFGSDFEASMTKVVTLSGNSIEQMEKMREATLALGPAVGKGPQEMADALLVITSTGQKGAKAMEILEAAAKAGAVGLGDTKDVARAVTSAITAYGESNLTAARATEILFKAVKDGGAEASEFAGTLGRVVGIASQVGVSFEELTGFVATFTRLGVDAAEATTSLRAVMTTFLQPTREAEQALAQYNLTIEQVRDSIKKNGLANALLDLQDRLKGNDQAMAAIFGNVRGLAGVLGVTGKQADNLREIIQHLKKDTNELGQAFDLTKKTLSFQWDELKAQVQRTSIAFGDALKPALVATFNTLKPGLDLVLKAVQAFGQLPAPVQTVGVALGALAGLAGPFLFLLGNLAAAALNLGKAYRYLASGEALGAITKVSPGAAAGLKSILTTANLTKVAIGALGAAIITFATIAIDKLLDELDKLIEAQKDLQDSVANANKAQGRAIAEASRIIGHQIATYAEAEQVLKAYSQGLKGVRLTTGDLAEAQKNLLPGQKLTVEQMQRLTQVSGDQLQAWQKGAAAAGIATQSLGRFGEGVGKIVVNMKASGDATTTTAAKMVTLSAEYEAAKKVLAGLTTEQRQALDAAIAMGKQAADAVPIFNAQFKGVTLTAAAFDIYKDKAQSAGKETASLAKDAKELADALGGAKAIKDADDLINALAKVPPIAKLTAEAQDTIRETTGKAAQVYRALGQEAPDAIRAVYLEAYKLTTLPRVDADLKDQYRALIPPPELKTQISQSYGDLLKMRVQLFQEMAVVTKTGLDAQLQALENQKQNELQVWRDATKNIPGFYAEIVPLIDQKYRILAQHAAAEVPKIIGPFEQIFKGIPDLISSAFTGGGGFKGAGKALASQLGAALGGKLFSGPNGLGQKVASGLLGKVGGALAGKIGGLVGMIGSPIGSILGSLGGKLVGGLFGKLFGGDAKKTKQMRAEFLQTAGGIDEIRKKAEYAGVSIDKLLKTKKSKEFTKEVEKLEAAFAETQKRVQGLLTDLGGVMEQGDIISRDLWKRLLNDKDKEEVKKALADVFTTSVNRALEGFNKIASGFTALSSGFKTGSKDMQRLLDAIGKGGGKKKFAPEFLAGVEDTLKKIGPLAQAAFGAALGSGKSFQDALAAIKPGLTEIQKVLTATGQSAGGFLGQLLGWSKIVENNQELFASLSGVNDMLVGLQNSGYLTQEAFSSLTSIISQAFGTLTGQGVSATDAIKTMQPQLQKAWELMHDFGFVTDETTAKILKQAEESGQVGDKFRSSTDRMIAAVETLVGKIDEFITRLGGGVANAAGQARAALDRIPDDIRINIRGRYIPPKNIPSGVTFSAGGPVMKAAAYAMGGAVKKAATYAMGTREPVEQPEYLATGGPPATAVAMVPKGSDRIPAMLTKGEWVIPADVVKALGSDFLKTLIKSKGATIPLKLVLSLITTGAEQSVGKVADWWKTAMAFVERNPLQVDAAVSGDALDDIAKLKAKLADVMPTGGLQYQVRVQDDALDTLRAKIQDLPESTPYRVAVDPKPIDDLRQRLLALPEATQYRVQVQDDAVEALRQKLAALPEETRYTLLTAAPGLAEIAKQIASLPAERDLRVKATQDGLDAIAHQIAALPQEQQLLLKAAAQGLTGIQQQIAALPEERRLQVNAAADGFSEIAKQIASLPAEQAFALRARAEGLTGIEKEIASLPAEQAFRLRAAASGLSEIGAQIERLPEARGLTVRARADGLPEITRQIAGLPEARGFTLRATPSGLGEIGAQIASLPAERAFLVTAQEAGLTGIAGQIAGLPTEHALRVTAAASGLTEIGQQVAALPAERAFLLQAREAGLTEIAGQISGLPTDGAFTLAATAPGLQQIAAQIVGLPDEQAFRLRAAADGLTEITRQVGALPVERALAVRATADGLSEIAGQISALPEARTLHLQATAEGLTAIERQIGSLPPEKAVLVRAAAEGLDAITKQIAALPPEQAVLVQAKAEGLTEIAQHIADLPTARALEIKAQIDGLQEVTRQIAAVPSERSLEVRATAPALRGIGDQIKALPEMRVFHVEATAPALSGIGKQIAALPAQQAFTVIAGESGLDNIDAAIRGIPPEIAVQIRTMAPQLGPIAKEIAALPAEKAVQVAVTAPALSGVSKQIAALPVERPFTLTATAPALPEVAKQIAALPVEKPFSIVAKPEGFREVAAGIKALPDAEKIPVTATPQGFNKVADAIQEIPTQRAVEFVATAEGLTSITKTLDALPADKVVAVTATAQGLDDVTAKVTAIPEERAVAVKATAEGLTDIVNGIRSLPAEQVFAVTAKASGLTEITKDVQAIPEERLLQVEAKEEGLTEIARKVEAIPEERRMEVQAKEQGLTEIANKVKAIPENRRMQLDAKEKGLTEIHQKVKAIPDQKRFELTATERGLSAIMADIRAIPTTHTLTVQVRERGLQELLRQIDAIPDEHPVAVPLTLYGLREVLTGIASIPRPVPVGVPLMLQGLAGVIAGINTIPKRYPVQVALPSPAAVRAQANAVVDQIIGALARIPSQITIQIGTSGSVKLPPVPTPPPVRLPPTTPSPPQNPMPPPTQSPLPLPPVPMPYPAPPPPPSSGGSFPGPGGFGTGSGGGSMGGQPNSGFGIPQRTYGSPNLRFEEWGDGTLAMLHGREAVVPEGRAGEFAQKHAETSSAAPVVIEKLADEITVNVPEGTPDPSAFGRKVIRGMFAELRRGGGDLDEFRHFVRKVQK